MRAQTQSLIILLVLSCCLLANTQDTTKERVKTECPKTSFWNSQACILQQRICSCSAPETCDQCLTLYGANSETQQCDACPTNCATCIKGSEVRNFKCCACIKGYQLIQGICVQLPNGPTQIGNQPFDVQPDYQQSTGSPVQCSSMDVTTSLCIQCPEKSFLNEFEFCEACVANCLSCNSRGTCQECDENYDWIPDANAEKALLQIIDYTLGSDGIPIIYGDYAFGAGACGWHCQDQHALTCAKNGLTTLTCTGGYYLRTPSGTCTACAIGCLTCNPATSCSECMSGYYLNSGVCTLCVGNQNFQVTPSCSSCVNGKSVTCDTCDTGADYVLLNSQCIVCSIVVPGCSTCVSVNSNISCSVCQNEYYLSINSTTNIATCIPCSQIPGQTGALYCYKDDYGAPVITQCTAGLWLAPQSGNTNTSICNENPNFCLTMQDSTQVCLTCGPNSFLVGGKCQTCDQIVGCTECNVINSKLTCQSCYKNNQSGSILNYALNSQSNTCTACPSQCSVCAPDSTCSACIYGYALQSTSCQQCTTTNCMTCALASLNDQLNQIITEVCQKCLPGYFLYTQNTEPPKITCYPCPYGCSQCGTTGMTCTECLSGFYLSNGGCNIGNIYCSVFADDGSCTTCQYGFRLDSGRCYHCIDFAGGFVCNANAGKECSSNILVSFMMVLLFIALQ